MMKKNKISKFDNAVNLISIKFRDKAITYRKLVKKYITMIYSFICSIIIGLIFFILFIVEVCK